MNQRVALTNRLTSLLKQYFPQALDWVGDLASVQACDFLTQWPTLAAVQRARPSTIRQFYRAHNCRKAAVIEARLAAIAALAPLTTDAAVIEPLSLSVQTYATQLRTLIAAIQTFDDRIAECLPRMPITTSSPAFRAPATSVRRGWRPPLGTDRSRWDSAAELQAHSGIAPVTERSGKTVWVHHRLACPKFVKQTFHEFADQSIRFSSGRARTTTSSGPAAMPIMRRYGPWPTNGFGFCFAAGRSADRTMKARTSTRFVDIGHRSRNILLDGAPQMSMPPAPRRDRIVCEPSRRPTRDVPW